MPRLDSMLHPRDELGQPHFQALKFRAWEHHFALTLVATWFIAETCLDWAQEFRLIPYYSTIMLSTFCLGFLYLMSVRFARRTPSASIVYPRGRDPRPSASRQSCPFPSLSPQKAS